MEIFTKSITLIIVGIIKFYQIFISPVMGPSCRHYPSCSQYSIESLRTHGVLKGLYLSVRRIWKCRPGGSHGYDPVPKRDK